ncbi:hypothetical protein bcgnr5372_45710 [Bacillus luti]|nr:hypothetical protein [Bacillus cereus]HDR8329663.1 hypothetical protein [Bacillus cereus]HDR8337045.1 hypothetical protein [Bacillus cereus]
MKKIIVGLFLAGTFLTGCQSEEADSDSATSSKKETESSVVETKVSDNMLPEQEYRPKLADILYGFSDFADKYHITIEQSAIQMDNTEWTKKVGEALYDLDVVSKKVHAIDTDSEYQEVHKILKETFKDFDEGSFVLKDAVASKDVEKFKKGNQIMQDTAVKLDRIYPLIDDIVGSKKTNSTVPKTEQVPAPKQDPTPAPTPEPKQEPAAPKNEPSNKPQVPPTTNNPSDNSADYDKYGNYKPADEMTQEEIKEELESMVKDHLGLPK